MNDLNKALGDINSIRRQVARSTEFRGYGPATIRGAPEEIITNVPREWARLARYCHETSTLTPRSRLRMYYRLLSVGRWLHATRPHIESPEQWTRTVASEAMAMSVD